MAIKLLTDSAADLDQAELAAKDILCVPLSVTFENETFLDGVELDKDTFYQKLLSSRNSFPKTSQPSPEAFLSHFEAAKAAGDQVVAILISSALSGTYQSAKIAQQMADYDGIYIIDSRTAVTAQRQLLDIAADLREKGHSAEAIAAAVTSLKDRSKLFAVVDTLEYLHRGGRLTKSQAMLGGLANLKPLITLDQEGKIDVCDKCLGKNKAYAKLLKALEKTPFDPAYPLYFVYSYDDGNVRKLMDQVRAAYPSAKLEACYNIGPTIGAHAGDNAFGLSYLAAE